MALKPDPKDPNFKEVTKHIEDLKKKGTAQAGEQLDKEFNMNTTGSKIVKPSSVEKAVIKK